MENYGEKGCFYTRSQARRTGLTCADDFPMTSELQVHPDPIGAMLEAAPSNWLLEYVCVSLCCISQDLVSSWCVCVCAGLVVSLQRLVALKTQIESGMD